MKTKQNGSTLIMAFVLVLLCPVSLLAQDSYSVRSDYSTDDQRTVPHLGLKAGLNFANIYDTKSEGLSDTYKLGFAGGLFFSIPFGAALGIQPEIMYSKKGYKGSGSVTATSFKYNRNFDYLDVPVQLQIKPSERVTILAGPVFSWLLNKRFTLKDGTLSSEDQTAFRQGNIRKYTFGVTGGLDFNLYPIVLSGRVGFDLRDNNGDGTMTDPRFKNAWIQTTLGVIF